MQPWTRSPAAAALLAVVLIIGGSAVDAVRTRSMAFHEVHDKILEIPFNLQDPNRHVSCLGSVVLHVAQLCTACCSPIDVIE
jgi:hypothetical protein